MFSSLIWYIYFLYITLALSTTFGKEYTKVLNVEPESTFFYLSSPKYFLLLSKSGTDNILL